MVGGTKDLWSIGDMENEISQEPKYENPVLFLGYGRFEYPYKPEEVLDKAWLFENTIELGGVGCWIWDGDISEDGFPKIKRLFVHRLVHEIMGYANGRHGKIHPCSISGLSCVNPQHYSIGGKSVIADQNIAAE